MSPVAEQLRVNEYHVGEIYAGRSPRVEATGPRIRHITRISPEDIGGNTPEVLDGCDAVYFLTHDPLTPNDDPVDGIGSVTFTEQGNVDLELDFPISTTQADRALFKKQTINDIETKGGIGRDRINIILPDNGDTIVARFTNELARV